MKFGLMNALTTFQRALEIVLADYSRQPCFIYLNDTNESRKSFNKHIEHL